MTETNCIFCQIINGEIPASIVHRDDRAVAFEDVNPQAPVHVLIITTEHIESLDEASQRDEAALGHLLRVAARIANERGLSENGYRAVINTGPAAGQSVFHIHVHLLGGRPFGWPPG